MQRWARDGMIEVRSLTLSLTHCMVVDCTYPILFNHSVMRLCGEIDDRGTADFGTDADAHELVALVLGEDGLELARVFLCGGVRHSAHHRQ